MSRALTPTEILAAFKTWGVKYTEQSGWKTRSNGGSFGTTVTGCMFHHTAGDASDAAELKVLINGRVGLSGPLCNFGAGDDGIIDIISAGPANHAGKGDPDTLAKVKSENYTGNIVPNENSSSPRAVGGNSKFYGWEVYYGIRNDKTVNPIQYRATILSMAAIIHALDKIDTANKWTSKSAIGHKEWTTNKIDPSGVVMSSARADIQWCLDNGPAKAAYWYRTGSKAAAPTPPPVKPTTPEVPPVATIQPVYRGTAPAKEVLTAFMTSDVFDAPGNSTTNPYWSGASWMKFTIAYAHNASVKADENAAALAAIKTELAAIKAALDKMNGATP